MFTSQLYRNTYNSNTVVNKEAVPVLLFKSERLSGEMLREARRENLYRFPC